MRGPPQGVLALRAELADPMLLLRDLSDERFGGVSSGLSFTGMTALIPRLRR